MATAQSANTRAHAERERLDLDLSVPELVASLFAGSGWMAELGRIGGRRASAAKAVAARKNGSERWAAQEPRVDRLVRSLGLRHRAAWLELRHVAARGGARSGVPLPPHEILDFLGWRVADHLVQQHLTRPCAIESLARCQS